MPIENATCENVTFGDWAPLVVSSCQTIQGCRPNSAVHQPERVANCVSTMLPTRTLSIHRFCQSFRFQIQSPHATAPMRMNSIPRSIIRWYTWNTRAAGAHWSFGNASRPVTVASVSW